MDVPSAACSLCCVLAGDFESAIPLYLHHLDHGLYAPEWGTQPVALGSTDFVSSNKLGAQMTVDPSCLRQRIATARHLSERMRKVGKLDEVGVGAHVKMRVVDAVYICGMLVLECP